MQPRPVFFLQSDRKRKVRLKIELPGRVASPVDERDHHSRCGFYESDCCAVPNISKYAQRNIYRKVGWNGDQIRHPSIDWSARSAWG